METFIFFLLLLGYLILLIYGMKFATNAGWFVVENVILLVILALTYEQAVLSFGKYIDEGVLLKNLNAARYWLHAMFTPLLILFSWDALKRANIEWARKRGVKIAVVFITISLIVYELFMEIIGLQLIAKWENGVLSYESVNGMKVPVMVIIVSLIILIVAIMLLKKIQWKWLLIGVVTMVIGNLLMIWIKMVSLGNIFEWILMLSLLATKRFQDNSRNIRESK